MIKSATVFWVTLAFAFCALEVHAAPAKVFGPWDAGAKKSLSRQGKKSKAKARHPMVGDAAKVPASGPPLPSVRLDPDVPEGLRSRANRKASSLSANPLYLASLFYRNFLTKVDGPRCQHLPTCSRLANQAVSRHGVVGILIGLDRIIQDDASSVLRALPLIRFGQGQRVFDPLDNYEFWTPSFRAFSQKVDEKGLVESDKSKAHDHKRTTH